MSVNFTLYINGSPKNKLKKTLSDAKSYDCLLKDDTSILDPVLVLETADNLSGYNYMYCAEFGRYYFINNIEAIGYNLWRISAHVDVLTTYRDKILANQAVIKRQQFKFNTYLNDPEWRVYANEDVITFKFSDSEFTKTLDYVLTVAGGA